jgi:hypothetical protein
MPTDSTKRAAIIESSLVDLGADTHWRQISVDKGQPAYRRDDKCRLGYLEQAPPSLRLVSHILWPAQGASQIAHDSCGRDSAIGLHPS